MDKEKEKDKLLDNDPRRPILARTVAHLSQEVGYDYISRDVLETLTEGLQSMIKEIGRTTRHFAELAGRVEANVGDVTLSLTELGIKIDPIGYRAFSRRHGRTIIPTPTGLPQPKTPAILSAGNRRTLPKYIPDYFPPLPDPHTYIRIPAPTKPLTDYVACREKLCQQKRDMERSLTKFFARTSSCFNFFRDQTDAFPLIAPKTTQIHYLDPLVPRDQIFEEDEASLPPINSVRKPEKIKETRLNDDDEIDDGESPPTKKAKLEESNEKTTWELIDNPFLRPVKIVDNKKLKNPGS